MINLGSLVDGKFSKSTKGGIILIFLLVPFISSVVSMLHVEHFLELGNVKWISITLAITYEIANLTILMAMVLMKKLRAFFVWACFIVLLSVQIVGNVYYSYDFILINIQNNPGYLTTFISFIQEMIEFENTKTIVFTLACFLGLPIPMVSLFLVKSVVDYLELGTEEEVTSIKEAVKKFEHEEPIATDGIKEKSSQKLTGAEEKPKDVVVVMTESVEDQERTEEHKNIIIDFSDTEKLVDQVQQIIKEDQPAVENSSGMINTEEKHDPIHIGVIIKPQDDNNGEYRG